MDAPESVRIRMYNVGFGDCFLLTFNYAAPVGGRSERNLLVDCGTKKRSPNGETVARIAKQIHEDCGGDGNLDVLVVTHRHQDHLSGFQGKASGFIDRLAPKLVIRPWTEDPDLGEDAQSPAAAAAATKPMPPEIGEASRAYLRGFRARTRYVEGMIAQIATTPGIGSASFREALGTYEELSNQQAINNLDRWSDGGKGTYVFYGSKPGIERFIPGIKAKVLGPPTPDQHDGIRRQVEDREDYWIAQARGLTQTAPALGIGMPSIPRGFSNIGNDGWLVRQVHKQAEQAALNLVRWLDDEMNNTSVILLLTVGRKKLLLGGDAQGESWDYTLKHDFARLSKVDVYKVGHHGSRNASPRKLIDAWCSDANKDRSMTALMSTTPDYYGEASNGTEVPRTPLVERLKARMGGLFFTTEDCPTGKLFMEVTCNDVTKVDS